MEPNLEFWGVDLETSGTNLERHVPIQLGITTPDGLTWTWLINWDFSHAAGRAGPSWDMEAQEVHGITRADLERDGQQPYQVAIAAADFIMAYSAVPARHRIMVGWNVGSFDLPFITRYLPYTAKQLAYRTVDLNALVFLISRTKEIPYSMLKNQAKAVGSSEAVGAGLQRKPHDAGFDSATALHSWDYLQDYNRRR